MNHALADLQARAASLLKEAQKGLDAQREGEQLLARYKRFVTGRDDALFLDTRFTGLNWTVRPEAIQRAAAAALGVFMTSDPSGAWRLPPLPSELSPQEQAEDRAGCYELLMNLADAVAQSPGADSSRRAAEALHLLDQTAGLRAGPSRAYHLQRADYLALKGNTEEATTERELAAALAPNDAFDFFLSGSRERARAR